MRLKSAVLTLSVVFGAPALASASDAPAPAAKPGGGVINVAILLLDKPYMTEFAGPLDVYHHVPADKLSVFTVSDSKAEHVTYEGLSFRTTYTIDDSPHVDVLVVPSGAGSLDADLKNERVVTWIKKVAKDARLVTSHCEGAFLLAQAGLLDQKHCTTFPSDVKGLKERFPAARVEADRRMVVDGNLITSAGGLASYEAALYVVERLLGKDQAQTISKALVFAPCNQPQAEGGR